MKLIIVTPEKKIFEDEIDQVTLPTSTGQITVLPDHTSLVTQLTPGELTIKQKGKQINLAVGFGFAEINTKQVSILTDLAKETLEISEKAAEEARKRAKEALKDRERLSAEEYAQVAASLEKSLAQLKVKRKHYPKTTPKTQNPD